MFTKIVLGLRHPKRLFEGALEWMFMFTSKRDTTSATFFFASS